VIEEDHLLVILGHHAILVLHRHAMQHPGLTVVIIIPLQKEGIPQGLQLLLWFLFFSCRNPIFVSYGGTCMPFASKANALAVPNCL